jgi:hypothetical protein
MSSNASRIFRSSLCIGVVGCTLIALGCGVPSPKPKAAQSLACNADTIEIQGNDSDQYTAIATGCGRKDVLYPDNREWASLREHAALEMSCGAGELEVNVVALDAFVVTGCGKKIVYKWNNHFRMVVDSASDTAPAAAPPAASTNPAPAAPPAASTDPAPAAPPAASTDPAPAATP